uniref:Uncharacterized protein n=1 Tax=Dicentrarchus labrax TaxID=13489 RepID=A0A8P4K5J2_DICLA
MSTSEVPIMDPALPSSSSTSSTSSTCAWTAPTPVASGAKRRREIDLEPGLDRDWKSELVTEPEAAVWPEQAASHTPSQNVYCEHEEEMNPPQSKRRITAASSVPGDSQPLPLTWSQDPLFTCSQYSEGEFYLTNQKNTTAQNFSDSEPSFFNSLQNEEAFGVHMDVEGRTSTQKSYKRVRCSQEDDEKENSRFLSFKSPSKHSALSHIDPLSSHKWTEPKTASPRKHIPVHLWTKADKEDSHDSQFEWKKPRSSPLKKLTSQKSCRAVDEDSLAMLFTQDSEGFRVIAHRGFNNIFFLFRSLMRKCRTRCNSLVQQHQQARTEGFDFI